VPGRHCSLMLAAVAAGTSPIIPELRIIRARGEGEQRATFFELFFDLVYVFAVTQLSHHLLTELSWAGAAETAFMLVALYWAWNYTTWMTNWFDPDTVPVRLVLVFVMLASLLMAVAIPQGFGEYALLFACAYSGLQIGRNAFVVAVTPRGVFNQNFRQILAWSVLSAPLWVAGGIVGAEAARWVLWLGALGLDLAAPLATYWLPGVGTTAMSQWQIEGAHFGERFQLFVIIVLGESVVLAGATASATGLSVDVVAAMLLAFLSSTALWWLYFGQLAGTVLERIRAATVEDRGRIGRDIYTYLHLPIIAGIVLVAVGDELAIAHPTDDLHGAGALVTLAGPALFLGGLMVCAARLGQTQSLPRAVAVLALLATVPLASGADGLLVSALVTALLAVLVVAEQLRGAR
jgi:low temperature requirement protein LtrA